MPPHNDELDEPNFRPRPKIGKFVAAAVILAVIGIGAYAYATRETPESRRREERIRARQEEGCPCGCDRSAKMAADLRRQGRAPALAAIDKTLVTIAERENVGYITERMVQHRLRMLALADELREGDPAPEPKRAERSTQRCKVATVEDQTLRVCANLIVHGERVEIVDGHDKLITPCFRLWLEIENLTGEERTIAPPSVEAGAIHFPVSRWYEEDGSGKAWDGVLRAREKVRVNVIGYIPEHVKPETSIRATITLDSLVVEQAAVALAVIHLQVP